ncbi:hypothetical protein HRbin35_00462 [bacterium HR35]|nr:hypothetical protein HRbin35_00462 [bacterium HR35]
MKKLSTILLISLLVFNLLFSSNLTLAQDQGPVERIPIISECIDQVQDPVGRILCIARGVFVILAIVAVVFAGISIFQAAWTFMSSGESEEKVKAARGKLMYALIGLVVAILSWAVSVLIARIFNLQI